jgi:hypothetical protein
MQEVNLNEKAVYDAEDRKLALEQLEFLTRLQKIEDKSRYHSCFIAANALATCMVALWVFLSLQ